MIITEMILKNFGKFKEKTYFLSEGVNLIYGENESGKSTIHTFLKGMLFGIARGRGRAAAKDTFCMYEPWENPNYYAGVLRFTCGGRKFRLERNFDKYAKSAVLFGEDDGEELSVEGGDLEMLLGGLKESDYENTISIGQLRSQTGQELVTELKNYAANYYATGDSDINLEGAQNALKERKKELEREVRETSARKQERRSKMEMEASYVWRDIHHLEKEIAQVEEELAVYKEKEEERLKEEQRKRELEETQPKSHHWRIHPIELLSMAGSLFFTFVLFHRPWNYLVAIVVALAEGLYIWNCMKEGSQKKRLNSDCEEEILVEESEREKLEWKLEKFQDDYQEKQVQYSNLQEQMEELDEFDDEYREQEKRRQALEIAAETLYRLSKEMQNQLGEDLNAKISGILSFITDGKYEKVWVDEDLHVNLLAEGKKISMEQVSRGTLEQIYFAIRMAASEMLYEEECPVILDDTFAYYDEKRLEKTLRWLMKNRKQILLFTCQKREEAILDQIGTIYNKIRI